jgi:hypothetical protein
MKDEANFILFFSNVYSLSEKYRNSYAIAFLTYYYVYSHQGCRENGWAPVKVLDSPPPFCLF